jgi:hypothetical protein
VGLRAVSDRCCGVGAPWGSIDAIAKFSKAPLHCAAASALGEVPGEEAHGD